MTNDQNGVSRPLAIEMPRSGVVFAESVHAQDFAMSARADAFHKLVYVLRGRVSYREEGRAAEGVPAGGLIAVPARTRHLLADERPSTLLLLCVSDGFFRDEPEIGAVWRGITGRKCRGFAVSGPARAQLESCWRRALIEQANPRIAAETATRALALQTFVQLARLPRTPAVEDAATRVAVVAREMSETFFERWTLDGAAERAGMSRRHFTTQFRTATGRTFWEHLTDLRLKHAAQLLERGGHSVAGVIFACGFGDVSQFYRLFRARYGMTPATARRAATSG